MLKTVTRAIPNYVMNIFLLPLEICKDMERVMSRFWWRSSNKKQKGIHWMSWKSMCKSKMSGSLDFQHMHDFNVALLGKQGWLLMTNPRSLVARIYKARYYPFTNFLTATVGGNPSFVWRSIMTAQDLIKLGTTCRPGKVFL